MSKKERDFCPEHLPCGQNQNRRTVLKVFGIGGVATAVGGFLGLRGPAAIQTATAKSMRPINESELDELFTMPAAGESWLRQPDDDHPYYVGADARFIDPEAREQFIAADRAWVNAFQRQDREFFRSRWLMPVDKQLAQAEAHSCSGSPSYYSCAIWGYSTRVQTGACPGWTYSCHAFFHCADGHGSYCFYYCGQCTPH